jgi:hypothetical protein
MEERPAMNFYEECVAQRNAMAESLAAELTGAVYRTALRHGTDAAWVDLELDIWRALTEAIKKWESTGRADSLDGAVVRRSPCEDAPPYVVGVGRLSADCSHFAGRG